MADLPTETLNAFAAWQSDRGFMLESIREFEEDVIHALGSKQLTNGWRVVPVTITITATGAGKEAA